VKKVKNTNSRNKPGKEQQETGKLINKARTSLEKMEEVTTVKTLQTEFVDIIPLGQYAENERKPVEDE